MLMFLWNPDTISTTTINQPLRPKISTSCSFSSFFSLSTPPGFVSSRLVWKSLSSSLSLSSDLKKRSSRDWERKWELGGRIRRRPSRIWNLCICWKSSWLFAIPSSFYFSLLFVVLNEIRFLKKKIPKKYQF